MACSLIEHKRINTTLAKAKALRGYVEPLITKSKNDTTHERRNVFSYLQNKDAVTELFREIAPKVGERPGGYVRIIKLGNRLGDAAEIAMVELVDFNETYESGTAKKKTSRRSRRGGKAATKETVSKDVKKEEPLVEDAEVVETPKAEKAPDVKAEEAPKEESEKKDEAKGE
jgi:large subunit ribosomal protein L17